MEYADIDRLWQMIICIFTIMIGVCLGLLCIDYEENIRIIHNMNISEGVN
jgi:hypothetical protein